MEGGGGGASPGGGGGGVEATSFALERLEQERRGAGGGVGVRGEGAAMDPVQLGQLIDALEVYQPTIPEEVTHYYLQQAGVTILDPKIKKIMSLATEKLLTAVINDAHQQGKLREQGKEGAGEVLEMDDLVRSLKKYGVMKVKVAEEIQGAPPPSSSSSSSSSSS